LQIWTQPEQWKGFLICVDKTAPKSFGVLLQLPPAMLEKAVEKLDPKWHLPLLKHATSDASRMAVTADHRRVLKK
jgi:symplekin